MSVMDGCEPENDLLIEMFYLVDVRFLLLHLTQLPSTVFGFGLPFPFLF